MLLVQTQIAPRIQEIMRTSENTQLVNACQTVMFPHHQRVEGSQFLARLTDGLELSDSALDEISAPAKRHRSTKNLSLYDPQAADQEVIKVLLFEFLNDKIKTGHKHARKLPEMIKMVEKHNLNFKEAVDDLQDACAEEDPQLDLAQLLNTASKSDSTSNLPSNIGENGKHITPACLACFQDLLHASLSLQLSQTLESAMGITRLYSQQAPAIDRLATGANVVVTTSTLSDKSLIYQVTMLQALEFLPVSCSL
ncbi:hypothetical protein PCANC_02317 [Puccinia coronata f. sp. avenae]|uniref:Uncharacterized protein n=1 Tax=Puccinia coronata f. sp. avenae TaxID=200324 RepID=A0A2N5VZD8_9BASI|nr:hypothetical protein PCANC_02317 [Puccinia coronata f. sp. avenae]